MKELSPETLQVCAEFWKIHKRGRNKRMPTSDCCKGCPIMSQCHIKTDMRTEEAYEETSAAKRVQMHKGAAAYLEKKERTC